ncbi:MAG: hypothetical protein ACK4ZJ_00140 [Allorhizobium sp.]
MTELAHSTLAKGLDRSDIDAMLRAAEPRRFQALSASLNLAFAVFLTLLGRAPFESMALWSVVAAIAAMALWRLSQHLWRDLAIAAIAPAIGEPWGQSLFVSGWGAVEIERRLGDLFSHDGARYTAWQSHGRYRDVVYRLSESTIWQRRRNNAPREVIHLMEVEITVPVSFVGSLKVRPRSGFARKIDDLVRRVSGESEQRIEIDPAFDAVFDTMMDRCDSVEALLTPAFRRAMLVLAAHYPRMYLEAGFEHGWFRLRLPIANLVFASASLAKPMTDLAEEADALWWDLTVPHRLIDALMGDLDGPLR